ncbi:MAG TPA: hypothetical protein VN903_36555, partial [Polyangia bacterium]|nr:hypothetical protein [Polyangia bacterium]
MNQARHTLRQDRQFQCRGSSAQMIERIAAGTRTPTPANNVSPMPIGSEAPPSRAVVLAIAKRITTGTTKTIAAMIRNASAPATRFSLSRFPQLGHQAPTTSIFRGFGVGAPHFGQATARVEISVPQSGHAISFGSAGSDAAAVAARRRSASIASASLSRFQRRNTPSATSTSEKIVCVIGGHLEGLRIAPRPCGRMEDTSVPLIVEG